MRRGQCCLGDRAMQGETLLHARWVLSLAEQQFAFAGDGEAAFREQLLDLHQNAVYADAVERPVAYRAAVDVEEARAWVPADAAALHRTRSAHRLFEPAPEVDVEGAAVEVLTVVGDAEGSARQHLVVLDGA